jgi:hypothetical protein
MDSAEIDQPPVLEARYANYFKVGHNATEFIVDFGQFHAGSSLHWLTRIVTGPFFLKELERMLGESIRAYEARYGEIQAPGDAEEFDS